MRGRFASTEFAESVIDAKLRLALDPKWANTKMYEAKLLIPPNIIISLGIVAPVKLPTGTVLPGGAEQIILPFNWPKEWIQGYRRVSGRQLQSRPRIGRTSLKKQPRASIRFIQRYARCAVVRMSKRSVRMNSLTLLAAKEGNTRCG